MRRRDATVDERMREEERGGDNSERRSESNLERKKSREAETEGFKINKMPRENVFGSLQNLSVFLIRLHLFSTFCSRSFPHSFVPEPFFSNDYLFLTYFKSSRNFLTFEHGVNAYFVS